MRCWRRCSSGWLGPSSGCWTSLSTISQETSKGIDAITINNLSSLRNRWHILAYNSSGRHPLRIAKSQDGVNWDAVISSVDDAGGDMDYPAIIQTSDKMLHLTYSWSDKQKVKHVILNPYVLLSEPTCVPSSCADFDGNGVVDARDVGDFAEGWLSNALGNLTDLDCDRKTDFHDFSFLAAQWLEVCP